ncbi:MAG: hypothetical protein ABL936_24735 [Aestuariivirga sp.]
MKKIIIGLLAAVSITAGMASLAEAGVKIKVILGESYYDQRMGPDYRYYDGRGWYRYNNHRANISCGQAKRIVRNHGFRDVLTRECEGRTYTFVAKRNGHRQQFTKLQIESIG